MNANNRDNISVMNNISAQETILRVQNKVFLDKPSQPVNFVKRKRWVLIALQQKGFKLFQ